MREHGQVLATYLTSMLLHAAAALILAMIVVPPDVRRELLVLLAAQRNEDTDEMTVEIDVIVQPEKLVDNAIDSHSALADAVRFASVPQPEVNVEPGDPMLDTEAIAGVVPPGARRTPLSDRTTAGGRQAAVKQYGGTVESEAAVVLGLRWLASVQRSDGSWNFAHVSGTGGAGSLKQCEMGATSMALLAFLGAGHIHDRDGPWRSVVRRGLNWLLSHQKLSDGRADLRGTVVGNEGLYVQGLATIAVCEAHALARRDRKLARCAQAAVNFVVHAQDPQGGGWRYQPRQPGDTSVVGWHVMALVSARMGRQRVPSTSLDRAEQFLDSVQANGGANYGYTGSQPGRPTTTAVGLLCRMYLGWRRDNPRLERGVQYLSGLGPSRDNMYYNYYATQVMKHWGGQLWKRWNEEMREQLVRTQIREGPGRGSWDPIGPHHQPGGRIYQTALSIMTLEVYYRHLPLYRDTAVSGTVR